ncbi:unnamed protein product [Trichobilharzia regenti]|nr:unnamed protein product [Trichobilharzia regenti]
MQDTDKGDTKCHFINDNQPSEGNDKLNSGGYTTCQSSDASSLEIASTTTLMATASSSSTSSATVMSPSCSSTTSKCSKMQFTSNDSSVSHSRKRRPDWCKWPMCAQYRTSGYCPRYNPEATSQSSQTCHAAHIGPNDHVPVSSDGQVRVCFDSMGLVNVSFLFK